MYDLLFAALVNLPPERGGDVRQPGGDRSAYEVAYDERADLEKSRAQYRNAVANGAGGPESYSKLFYVDVRLRLDGEAIEAGRRYIALRPDDERFRLDYAYELSRAKEPGADVYFERLTHSANADIAQRARAELKAAQPAGSAVPDPAVSEGYAALKKGDRSTAIADFQQHLTAFPDDAAVWLDLAYAQSAAGDHPASLASTDHYLALRPGDERGQLQRAYQLDAVGEHAAADVLFKQLSNSNDPAVAKSAKDAAARGGGGRTAPSAGSENPQASDRAGAIAGYKQQLEAHPADAAAWLALAYAQSGGNDHAAAIESLDRYLALRPNEPAAELQRAYELDAVGRHGDARASYRRLASGNDPQIAAKAREQLASSTEERSTGAQSEAWVEWDSRFRDVLYGIDTKVRGNAGSVQPYAALSLSSDTRSNAGPVPTIYNNNAVVAALGLRAKIAPGAHLYVEGGEFFGLLDQGSYPALRVGFGYYGERGRAPGAKTSLDFDIAHYSYYAGDLISYATVRHFAPIDRHLSALFGGNLGLDGQMRYYNNFLEGFAGVQVSASPVTFRLIEVYGTYIRGLAAPTQHYWAFRPIVFYDARF